MNTIVLRSKTANERVKAKTKRGGNGGGGGRKGSGYVWDGPKDPNVPWSRLERNAKGELILRTKAVPKSAS